jgi:hypothetical protein
MIDFSHLVEDVQQFLIGRAAGGQGVTDGDHALPMAAERPLFDP